MTDKVAFLVNTTNEREVKMKKKKILGITALLPLVLCNFAAMPVYAEVTDLQEADTSAEMTSAECEVIYKSTYDFSEEIPKYPELEVSASGYEGIYDGKSHEINVDCKTEDATILYSTDGKTYTTKKPAYTDAGTYVTYYKVEKDGYTTTTGSAVVEIRKATIDYTSSDYIGIYDGKEHGIDLSVATKNCKILYSEDGINFTSKKPEYKEPGTYVVYYKIQKDNYETVTGSNIVTIKEKDGTVKNNSQNNNSQDNSNVDGNADSGISKVQTGDDGHIFFYAAMFIASVFGLAKSRGRKEKVNL